MRIVLAINVVLFVVEFASGLLARSTALLSDSLDNLGDATTYAFGLYAVARGERTKARVALIKGGLILIAALFVLGQVAYAITHPGVPVFEAMGIVSLIALTANGTCLALLWKHRAEDVNMSSVWECSRNDIASNVSVFVAAAAVWAADAAWPDLLVGVALAILLLKSAFNVSRSAFVQLRALELGRGYCSVSVPERLTPPLNAGERLAPPAIQDLRSRGSGRTRKSGEA